MPFTTAERAAMIERYAHGPTLLKRALAKVPADALKWKPAAGKWSAHEIVVHCADSEANAHMRLRYLIAEADPGIGGYDQDEWALAFDYHAHPLEPALATVEAVRANTLPLLRRMTDRDWQKTGRHTESGRYATEDWLAIYAEHLEKHSRQIERNRADSTEGFGQGRSPAVVVRAGWADGDRPVVCRRGDPHRDPQGRRLHAGAHAERAAAARHSALRREPPEWHLVAAVHGARAGTVRTGGPLEPRARESGLGRAQRVFAGLVRGPSARVDHGLDPGRARARRRRQAAAEQLRASEPHADSAGARRGH